MIDLPLIAGILTGSGGRMLPATGPVHLRMDGAFLSATKRPSRWGEPGEGRGKGRAFTLTIHAEEVLRRCSLVIFEGSRLQHRPLSVVEFNRAAACV